MNKNKLAVLVILFFAITLFGIATDGFRAFTSETARSLALVKEKPKIPDLILQDSKSRSYSFSNLTKGKYTFLTFMYTNCGTVCPQLEMNMEDVYNNIPTKYFEKDLVFLSISFDPSRDNSEVLETYSSYFDSDGEKWRMATVPNKKELEHLLQTLGVVVIPDGYGNFQHNSAFYLVGPDGHLIDIMDYTNTTAATNTVLNYLTLEGGD
ncbi:SCO family protein [Aquibacillus kalidii]|uniref:SCO family protein n=1 Tax=Aquibacillus kalidii TaxID=2762597 RepID=UPI0016460995|nr:SCO family protein [Aquibacillus kalidii]